MIEIVYDKEKERVFDLRYDFHKYIPDSYFVQYPKNTELHYVQELFSGDSNIKFIGALPMIWSIHYKYLYKNKGFILVLDEDYDMINYASENPNDRREIAEYIRSLIRKKCNKSIG